MKSIVATALFVSTVLGNPVNLDWQREMTHDEFVSFNEGHLKAMFQAWSRFFNKPYDGLGSNGGDEPLRYSIWAENLERIAKINSEGLTYKLRMNQFGDMTDDEFSEHMSCIKAGEFIAEKAKEESFDEVLLGNEGLGALPDSVDWTQQGVVTPVKNQGQCGSCWAFSATGSMECEYAIRTGTLNSLSEQQLVDCSGAYGNEGCNGGWYYDAWKYAEKDGGLCLENAYPYTARDGTCKASSCGTKYNVPKSYAEVRADDDTALATASAAGCVSVAIEADQTSFQYYSSGVLTGVCGTRIDHAVLIVGYGENSQGQEYWKVKNSWGTSWGDKGYVLICRNCNKNGSKGECGINMYPYTVSE